MGTVTRKRAASPDERRARYLAAQTRYNTSRLGRARYARYEAANPERAGTRWEPSRDAYRRAEGLY